MNEPLVTTHSTSLITTIVLLLYISNIKANLTTPKNVPKCQLCHKLSTTKINVHLIPHSHDDVGWLKTFTQYYYGTGNFEHYADAGVQYILSSTVEALKTNPNRRFIQVETAFFWKWWRKQNFTTRQDVTNLVNNGQLEIVNGAWSMNDEATTNYQSIVDQFTWGFRILEHNVGKCGRPKIGWQIDPFGHSREHASLLKQFGFEGLVIERIDYRDKKRRNEDQSLEFVWKTSDNLEDSQIFTTMFPNQYNSEPGFRFDIMYGEKIENFNWKEKVHDFAKILDKYSAYYKSSNMMMPMGNDFTYQVAETNFENIDKLIKGFKHHKRYNVFYSTPSCYVQAVQNEMDNKMVLLEEKSDDFFPYASKINSYWTGYYTSRPTLKRFERIGNNILQIVKQLTAFSRINNHSYDIYTLDLRQAMGIMQHHDAITGTERQEVADDYARMLHQSIKKAEEPISDILIKLTKLKVHAKLNFSTCLLCNVSVCANSQKDKFLVAVYNPLAQIVTHYVRLPVNYVDYNITGPDGEEVYDVVDPIHTFGYLQIDETVGLNDLVFAARDLPPLGFKLYYVERISTENRRAPFKRSASDNLVFGTETNGFTIDPFSGKLSSVTLRGRTKEVTQEFLYYTSLYSGAYLFRPYHFEAIPVAYTNIARSVFYRGNLIDEYHQTINDEITQIIRVYKNEADPFIEFDWLVGDLHFTHAGGKEVITRYTINNFNNDNTFYTDSNGREQIQRILNYRRDYEYDPTEEPVASNYYPVTSKIVIKDETKGLQMAVLNDRAQGGSSLTNGNIELMLHRRLTMDDYLGVGEVLNEIQYGRGLYVRGQHYLTFGKMASENETASTFERKLAKEKLLSPLVLTADATGHAIASENIQNLINFTFAGLKRALPDNVHLLTLEPWIDSYILRLEHILEKNEDPELSKPVTVDLNDLFTLFSITKIKETTLGANELLKNDLDLETTKKVTLNPMQIRTFIFETDRNNVGGHEDSDGDDNDAISNSGTTVSTVYQVICLVLASVILLHVVVNVDT